MTAPASPGSSFHAHDLIVLVGGAALVAVGVAIGSAGGTTSYARFERDGLSVPYPDSARWFPPTGNTGPAVISSVQCSSDPSAACADQPTARIAFKQGFTSKQVMAADSAAELVGAAIAAGKTDGDGRFTMKPKVPKGSYTVAVIGQGYKLIVEDAGLEIDASTPAVYRPWPKITVARCTGASCVD